MKLLLTLSIILATAFTASAAVNDNFYFVGANGLEGTPAKEVRSCSENNRDAEVKLGPKFKQWISGLSQTAQQKMFDLKRCEVMGIELLDQPGRKYRTMKDLEQRAQGLSIYRLVDGNLELASSVAAPVQYIVVVPEVAKKDLKLSELNLCVNPEKKDTYRRKARSVSNCHNLDQFVYVFTKYKEYPGEMQTNSALFDKKDFDSLNKKGKFKGLKVYKLVGEKLEPVK